MRDRQKARDSEGERERDKWRETVVMRGRQKEGERGRQIERETERGSRIWQRPWP